MVTGIEHDNDTATDGLSDRQVDAARLIATNPDRPKKDIAASLKISRRTVFRWLANERFVDKVNQFRRSPVLRNDPDAIFATLDERAKKALFERLKQEQEPYRLPEIQAIEGKIMDIAKNDHTVNRRPTKKAVSEVALLLGRLNANALCFVRYNPDGTPHYKDRLDKISWYLHDEMIRARRFGSKTLSIAINEALSSAILSRPEQWLWGSRRFFTRPPGEVPGPDGLPPPAAARL